MSRAPVDFDEMYGLIAKREPFSLDTSKIIDIAYQDKKGYSLLKTLATKKYFVLVDEVIKEIDGLKRARDLPKKVKTYLSNFIDAYKRTHKRTEESMDKDAERVKKFLSPLINLVPKKVLADVIVALPDSFYNSIKDDLENDLLFDNELLRLDKKISDRFNDLLKENKIENLITDKEKAEYIRDLHNKKEKMIDEIRALKHDPKVLQVKMDEYSHENHSADIEIVSDDIAHNRKTRSSDSDQKWLYNFFIISERQFA